MHLNCAVESVELNRKLALLEPTRPLGPAVPSEMLGAVSSLKYTSIERSLKIWKVQSAFAKSPPVSCGSQLILDPSPFVSTHLTKCQPRLDSNDETLAWRVVIVPIP